MAAPAGFFPFFEPDVLTATDYYPFGMEMPGRKYNPQGYRYGFQKQEKDENIYGQGNAYSFEYRVYDSRLGRFLSIDPLSGIFPWNSTYAFSENRVIDSYEFEGLEKVSIHNYAFAPFDDFAGFFHGDGDGRMFGGQVNPSKQGEEGFRIGSKVMLNLATAKVIRVYTS